MEGNKKTAKTAMESVKKGMQKALAFCIPFCIFPISPQFRHPEVIIPTTSGIFKTDDLACWNSTPQPPFP
jgi:hypothetical protein